MTFDYFRLHPNHSTVIKRASLSTRNFSTSFPSFHRAWRNNDREKFGVTRF